MIGTDVAIAFPRSPMVTAQAAWDLAALSGGRFILGLGTQVKAHLERRFSVPGERPAARIREYILALRAIFDAFAERAPLRFEGEFHRFSLLTDFFDPGPIEVADPPIYLAGVNERLGPGGRRGGRRFLRPPAELAEVPHRGGAPVHRGRGEEGRP